MTRQSRRRFLAGTAAVTAGGLAGCLGAANTGGSVGSADTVESSFFVFSDFTGRVAGDQMRVRNLVPFGQHGHGWEPGPDVQRRVFDATAFVYVGEGFQPWADRLVQNLASDGADVAVIEARRGIDLLSGADDHDEHGEHDEHGTNEGDHAADHETDEGEHDDHDDHETDEGDHDHAGADPHFWLDPTRATQAVENIAAGLRDVDPANEAAYTENAAAYADRLAALDDTYRERLAGRTRDTVLVAGHNSFRYLGDRYGFDVAALTGVAPDDEPTPQDVRRAQRIIDEHDVEYVLAPVFESDRAAQQLVAETSARDALPLTPVPTLTDEWADEGWGFVDVMERVNLPSLAAALGAE
ncbi:metal ABC transporter substrate-binding protein [Salinigranum sp.]|uniref:metal ABC transporter substrate-binding protein n=1 Tax=Salinigranum sp. TaxID=1966351 RepID=UPI0035640701